MKPAVLLALALACAPAPALAQAISGAAVAVDGDTLDMTGFRVRLFGVDAVELGQTCQRGADAWRCGEDARAQLGALVDGLTVTCEQRDTDAYGRMVAVCRADGVDLSAAMARSGFAIALSEFSTDYAPSADVARQLRAGIWSAEFAAPAEWRAAHPRADAVTRPVRVADAGELRGNARGGAGGGVYYRNCAAARAAGAAPLYRGQAGYRAAMDADGDGVACEPYRGRR